MSGAAALERLREHLEQQARLTRDQAAEAGWAWGSLEDLVLAAGRGYLPAPTLREVTTGNDAAHAAADLHLTYVEGYVLTASQDVVAGAWAADEHGLVHVGPTGAAYWGIPLSERDRQRLRRRTGTTYALLDTAHDRHARYAVLRYGLAGLGVADRPADEGS